MNYRVRVGSRYWETVDEELVSAVEQELPALNQLATLEGLAQRATHWRVNIHETELRLCIAAIWRNDRMVEEAKTVLETREPGTGWVREAEQGLRK